MHDELPKKVPSTPEEKIDAFVDELISIGEEAAMYGAQPPDEAAVAERDNTARVKQIKMELRILVVGEVKTDAECVFEINELAKKIANGCGWEITEGENVLFHKHKSPRGRMFWQAACIAYEHITHTEVGDLKNAIDIGEIS